MTKIQQNICYRFVEISLFYMIMKLYALLWNTLGEWNRITDRGLVKWLITKCLLETLPPTNDLSWSCLKMKHSGDSNAALFGHC